MSTVKEIEAAIPKLSRAEIEEIRDWIDDYLEDRLELTENFTAKISTVDTVEQIERVIEQLPAEDFEKLSAWMEQRRRAHSTRYSDPERARTSSVMRDHQGFLNSYVAEAEGLYLDAASR